MQKIYRTIKNIGRRISGGWSAIGPTMLVESLDVRSKRWVRSEIKLFEISRAYHAVINMGDALFTIGGFDGNEYYRSTRKFDLATMVFIFRFSTVYPLQ